MSARDTVLYRRRGPASFHLYWWPETRSYWVDLDWRFRTFLAFPLWRPDMNKHINRILIGGVVTLLLLLTILLLMRLPPVGWNILCFLLVAWSVGLLIEMRRK